MAKLNFCRKTAHIRSLLLEGRRDEARAEVVQLLRDGYSTRPFLTLCAEMLDPAPKKRGQPSRPPKNWFEIAERFEELRDHGKTDEVARELLAKEFGVAERTIARAVKIYRDAEDDGRE